MKYTNSEKYVANISSKVDGLRQMTFDSIEWAEFYLSQTFISEEEFEILKRMGSYSAQDGNMYTLRRVISKK